MINNRISSFAPIVDDQSKIIILGSVPGNKSLEMQQYYAHPQNQFWKILFAIFNSDFTSDYQQRLDFLKANHIALWDVIDTCERKGSLDTAIRKEEANDVAQLLTTFPEIKAIFCNGQKSFKNVKNMNFNRNIPVHCLPSTSPAYTKPLALKLQEWQEILFYLQF